jgi:eukaryotic-like serine/threonine-protein kinase
MLSSQPRRPIDDPLQPAPDPEGEPRADVLVELAKPDALVTVLRGSNSSSLRRKGMPQPPGSIPLPPPGELIDTFRLEEAIGAGGMGAVYRALDTKLERLVALKLLPPDQAADVEVVRRFYQEGRSAAQLDHENIARVYSIGQDGYLHYIAFEYIEGVTIRQRVEQDGPMPVAEAVDIALQIAHALVHASQRGVVHRDIKPSNIILTPQGRAKLVDMGLARRFERDCDHGLTQTGMTLGTFDYISPEQARDPRDVDVRSDLYSLGCTLFHMLTGRPPFPGGTVLQKLIQHQEEPPADVRTMNPAVPAELAGVITKLMAKDRDRRYQSPEQLVRDLLNLAAAVGLERTPAQLEYWMAHGHRPTWERHLVWMLPALGFFVVITGLVWWGYEFSKPSSGQARHNTPASGRQSQDLNFPGGPDGAEIGLSPGSVVEETEPVNPQSAYPRTIRVASNEDLLGILATAPRRAVVVLSDEGPYRVGERAWSGRAPAALANLDLTIKAEAGVRPRLKFADDARRTDPPPKWILQFVGGQVTLEGLVFELEAILPDEPVAAIRAEDAELILRSCSFFRSGPNGGEGGEVAAIRVHAVPPRSPRGDRAPALYADSCHFDGGQVGVIADGPADIVLRDCTMGPGQPAIWLDNARSSVAVPADIRLIHSSIFAGDGPVFRFEGGPVRAWVDDCVISPTGRSPATLAMIDEPRNLLWRGRGNLYSQIENYLVFFGKEQSRSPIANFATWEQGATEPREVGSRLSVSSVWDASEPLKSLALERENPTRAFLLNPRLAADSDVGARQGPFGSNLKNAMLAQRTTNEPAESLPAPRRSGGEVAAARPSGVSETAGSPPTTPERPAAEAAVETSGDSPSSLSPMDPMNLPSMPPMPTTGATSPPESEIPGAVEVPTPSPPAPATRVESTKAATPTPVSPGRRPVTPFSDEDVIRSSEQLVTMFKELGPRGGSLRIAAGVDIEIPTILIEGTGKYQLTAEPGPNRPRLRLRPPDVLPSASPTAWSVMWKLRSGSLRLEGLDLIVLDQENLRTDRVALAALLPDTALTMIDCTLTVDVRRSTSSVFVIRPPNENQRPRSPEPTVRRAAAISLKDCFVRSGGDAVNIAAGRELRLDLTNVLIGTEGSLIHALGSPRRRPLDPAAIEVKMAQVTARVKGGLVHLESTPDEPELSAVKIGAEDSIVSTTAGDDPLFRLEGQDQLDQLGNKITWESRKVAYHRIKTYRRDEIVQTGSLPRTYDRENWTRAFLPKDESPMLGNVKFLHEADAPPPAWKLGLDDFRLEPDTPAAQVGPDLGKVPSPPPADDL